MWRPSGRLCGCTRVHCDRGHAAAGHALSHRCPDDYVSVTTRHDGSTTDYTHYVAVHIIRDAFTLRRRLVWNDGRPFACTLRADLGKLVHSLAFPG